MMYNNGNYWVAGLCPSSGILNFRPQVKGEIRAQLGPLQLTFRIPIDGQSPETQ
jgi:hypothetical protein